MDIDSPGSLRAGPHFLLLAFVLELPRSSAFVPLRASSDLFRLPSLSLSFEVYLLNELLLGCLGSDVVLSSEDEEMEPVLDASACSTEEIGCRARSSFL